MGTIVCAVDDSPEAEEALRVAVRLSGDAALRLVVVHVEKRTSRIDGRVRRSNAAGSCSTGSSPTQGLNGGADKRVEVGERANELARVAAEEAASVILVGSRGRHWWRRRSTSRLDGRASRDCGLPGRGRPAGATTLGRPPVTT